MSRTPPPSPLTGALVGGLLAAALLAALFVAAVAVGLPFAPFDLFDLMARILPIEIIRFGIDLILSVIAALNLEDTSRSAKTAEHIIAVAQVLALGVVAGGLAFALLRRAKPQQYRAGGIVAGLVIGLPLAALGLALNTASAVAPLVGAAWTALAFAGWGLALGWVYERLAAARPAAVVAEPEPDSVAAALATVRPIDRRQFLVQLGGATAAITVVGAGVGALLGQGQDEAALPGANAETTQTPQVAWSQTNPLPNAGEALMPAPGTRPEFTPVRDHYRIDINSLPPVLRFDEWTLDFGGMVENPLKLTVGDIRSAYTPAHQFVTLSCISNPVGGDLIGTQRWTGVPLKTILEQVKPLPEARYLTIRAADGFHETVVIADALADERIMLAYDWDGLPLTTAHGFPLRIYIPDLYGMKQPKWITSIEATDRYEEGYWVRRRWDEVAQVQMTAVIDTVAVDQIVTEGERQLVPVGGIAYAGDQGISKVEISVDDGDWQTASLRAPISGTTWVIWRYDWPFEAGQHTFRVRCTDADGTPQTADVRDEFPSGATGLHSRRATA